MRTSDFDYQLPQELIAQTPLEVRDASRLLVLDRDHEVLVHSKVTHLPQFLRPGDLIVANNSRVMAARLRGHKGGSGGKVELLLLHPIANGNWEALAKPARRLGPGTKIDIGDSGHVIEIVQRLGEGRVELAIEPNLIENLHRIGTVPLPPYIHECLDDPNRYQTIYSSRSGSAAAPTAGLHFTQELMGRLRSVGVGWTEVTLDIGLDTFRPITVDDVADHHMHAETCGIELEAVEAIAATKAGGGRVIALGTTAARTLETAGRL